MRVLTPTENNRLNELIGFIGMTIAVLTALALISYSPHDPSFNVSAESSDLHSARNWIGPVGAYSADLLFQGFGYAAFLLPVGMFIMGSRWFRSELVESPAVKIVGCTLLVLMLPTMLTLWHVPEVRGAIPPGGLLGHLVSAGLRSGFNTVGANLVAVAIFFVALFLTTKFSFIETHETIARAAQQTECDRSDQGTLLPPGARNAKTSACRKRLAEIKSQGRAADPAANRGRSGWQRRCRSRGTRGIRRRGIRAPARHRIPQ